MFKKLLCCSSKEQKDKVINIKLLYASGNQISLLWGLILLTLMVVSCLYEFESEKHASGGSSLIVNTTSPTQKILAPTTSPTHSPINDRPLIELNWGTFKFQANGNGKVQAILRLDEQVSYSKDSFIFRCYSNIEDQYTTLYIGYQTFNQESFLCNNQSYFNQYSHTLFELTSQGFFIVQNGFSDNILQFVLAFRPKNQFYYNNTEFIFITPLSIKQNSHKVSTSLTKWFSQKNDSQFFYNKTMKQTDDDSLLSNTTNNHLFK